jgi:hypothetical protein
MAAPGVNPNIILVFLHQLSWWANSSGEVCHQNNVGIYTRLISCPQWHAPAWLPCRDLLLVERQEVEALRHLRTHEEGSVRGALRYNGFVPQTVV